MVNAYPGYQQKLKSCKTTIIRGKKAEGSSIPILRSWWLSVQMRKHGGAVDRGKDGSQCGAERGSAQPRHLIVIRSAIWTDKTRRRIDRWWLRELVRDSRTFFLFLSFFFSHVAKDLSIRLPYYCTCAWAQNGTRAFALLLGRVVLCASEMLWTWNGRTPGTVHLFAFILFHLGGMYANLCTDLPVSWFV